MVRTRLNIGCRYSTPVRKRPLHPTRGHFTPEPSQTQAPVTPATEPERRAGGSLTTTRAGARCSAWRSAHPRESFWAEFLRSLARRGLRGVQLVISDDHKGLKAAASRILGATWQRCRVHFARNLLAHAGRQDRRVVSAFVATAFAQEDAGAAGAQWRQVADQLRPKAPKLAALMDEAEHDVLAYMNFPAAHRAKLNSTNPLERLHGEIKRRTNVVGVRRAVLPLEGPLLRLSPQRRRHHPPRRRHLAGTKRRVGRPESPLHDPRIHRAGERQCSYQAATRGRLSVPAQTAGCRVERNALTPRHAPSVLTI